MCRSREPATRTGARATALLATALLLLALPVAAVRAAPATLVSPVPGGAPLRADAVFQWTAVANASVYYLYVGTSPGAKDIVNSGELAGTSLPVSGLPAASTVYVRLSTKDSGSWVYVDYVFTTDDRARLLTPNDHATVSPAAFKVSWTRVAGAQAYYLYVGSSPGAKDYLDSGEVQGLQQWVTSLPTGAPGYVRLYTKRADRWVYVEATVAAASAAALTAPAAGGAPLLADTLFQWSTVPTASAYYLYIGTSVGAKDLVDSGELAQTSWQARGLPAGSTVYVRLYTKDTGVWVYLDYAFTTADRAQLISPHDGDAVNPNGLQVAWTRVTAAQAYYLYVGSSSGASDLINSGEIQAMTQWLPSLPDGTTVYIRLYTKRANAWLYVAATVTVKTFRAQLIGATSSAAAASALGLQVIPTNYQFQWAPVAGAGAYYLYIGTSVGTKNLVDTGQLSGTSWQGNLPAASTLYVRLYTFDQGYWVYVDYVFVTDDRARLTAPNDGDTVSPGGMQVSWTPVSDALSYYLYVGSSPGASDLVNTGEIQSLTQWVAALPDAAPAYIRLFTKRANTWLYVDATVNVQGTRARLLNPVPGDAGADPRPVQLIWSSVAGASAYYVHIGSAPDLTDAFDSGQMPAPTTTVLGPLLVGGRTYFLRLYTLFNGVWGYRDYSFTTRAWASLLAPAAGAQGQDPNQSLQWNAVDGATSYRLDLGTAVGATDLGSSGNTTATQFAVVGLPGGATIYMRLSTTVAGQAHSEDTVIGTRAVPRFIAPAPGRYGVTAPVTFRWNRVVGADTFVLDVGTTPGGLDVLSQIGVGLGGSYQMSSLPAADPLYARIWARIGGVWYHDDTVISSHGAPGPAAIVYPTDGGYAAGARLFEWAGVPLGAQYQLLIGTAPGGSELFQSGFVSGTKVYVPSLPQGPTLYATVQTRFLAGGTAATASSFTAGNTALSATQRRDLAIGLAATIRGMAANTDPTPFSVLFNVTRYQGRDYSNCTDFATSMLQAVRESNLGVATRLANSCLVPDNDDCHTAVELLDSSTGRWAIADPTFGITVTRTSDQTLAGAVDISAAARAMQWSAIQMNYLTPTGDAYLRSYYIDYPLLFLDLYADNDSALQQPEADASPYYANLGSAVSAAGFYALMCAPGAVSVAATIDAVATVMGCDSVNNVTYVFAATNISGLDPGAAIVSPRRFMF